LLRRVPPLGVTLPQSACLFVAGWRLPLQLQVPLAPGPSSGAANIRIFDHGPTLVRRRPRLSWAVSSAGTCSELHVRRSVLVAP